MIDWSTSLANWDIGSELWPIVRDCGLALGIALALLALGLLFYRLTQPRSKS